MVLSTRFTPLVPSAMFRPLALLPCDPSPLFSPLFRRSLATLDYHVPGAAQHPVKPVPLKQALTWYEVMELNTRKYNKRFPAVPLTPLQRKIVWVTSRGVGLIQALILLCFAGVFTSPIWALLYFNWKKRHLEKKYWLLKGEIN